MGSYVSVNWWGLINYLVRLWRSINGRSAPLAWSSSVMVFLVLNCLQMGNVFSLHGVCFAFVLSSYVWREEMFPRSLLNRSIFGSSRSQLRMNGFLTCTQFCVVHNPPFIFLFETGRPRGFPRVTSNPIRHDHQTGKADTWIFPSLTGIFLFITVGK